jgi:hypothetical protein
VGAIDNLRHRDINMGLGAARDDKGTADREAFDASGENASHAPLLAQRWRLSKRRRNATVAGMDEDESVELDAVAAVARITALEMLVRQMMIVQLRILDRMGEIKLTPDYVKTVAAAYAEKVDASPIIESNSPEVNYEFKVNVLHNLERFFDELETHVRDNPS